MSEAVVTASVVAAIVSVTAAFIAWFKEAAIAATKADTERQLAGFQSLLDSETEKLKAKLQAGLVSHEVTERLRSDLRLKMQIADEERVSKQFEALRECVGLSNGIVLSFSSPNTTGDALKQSAVLTSKLATSHYLLPDELVESASQVEKDLRRLVAAAAAHKEGLGDINRTIVQSLDRFEEAARAWRKKSRSALLDGVRLVDAQTPT